MGRPVGRPTSRLTDNLAANIVITLRSNGFMPLVVVLFNGLYVSRAGIPGHG
jgi:hypothetical protein